MSKYSLGNNANKQRILNDMDTHPWVKKGYLVEVSRDGCTSMSWGGVSICYLLIP